jgi:uncharacterized protein (DUF58 family)
LAGSGLGGVAEAASRITAEGQAALLMGAALAGGGAVVGGDDGALLAAMGLALIAIVLVDSYVFAVRLGLASRLRAVRILPQPLLEGSKATIEVRLYNPSSIPLGPIVASDNPPGVFSIEGATSGWGYVASHAPSMLKYTVVPRVGRHEWGRLRVAVRDPLGFYEGSVEVEAGPSVVRVYPRSPLAPRVLASVAAASALGGRGSGRRGVGTEFLELREYVPGDDLRLVDWKATARTGRLIVKVFEEEALPRVAVIVDASPPMFEVGCGGEAGVEYASRLAVAVAELVGRVGGYARLTVLGWWGERVVVGWASGRGLAGRFGAALASSLRWPRDGASCDSASVAGALASEVLESAKPGSTVVLVSDFCLDASAVRLFAERVRGRLPPRSRLVVVVPPVGRGGCGLRRAFVGRVRGLLGGTGVEVYSGPVSVLLRGVAGL